MRVVGSLSLVLLCTLGTCSAFSLGGRGPSKLGTQPRALRAVVPFMDDGIDEQEEESWGSAAPQKPDLFVPVLVGASFGGYALIVLYDIFFGKGLCGVTIQCSNSPW